MVLTLTSGFVDAHVDPLIDLPTKESYQAPKPNKPGLVLAF